ncbi:MAG: hypothetical protein EBS07_01495 [Sphingobacteriia bacterium]|nr:hypothetical protein [Sphingobacteriia bacterium]
MGKRTHRLRMPDSGSISQFPPLGTEIFIILLNGTQLHGYLTQAKADTIVLTDVLFPVYHRKVNQHHFSLGEIRELCWDEVTLY